MATRPALAGQGGHLLRHFEGIPADAIAVTTRYPVPSSLSPALPSAITVLCILAAATGAGHGLARAGRWPWLLLLALVFTPVLPVVDIYTFSGPQDALPEAQRSWFGARGMMLVVLRELFLAALLSAVNRARYHATISSLESLLFSSSCGCPGNIEPLIPGPRTVRCASLDMNEPVRR